MTLARDVNVVDDDSNWAVLSMLRFFLAMVVLLGHNDFYVGGRHDWTAIGLWLNQGSAVFGFFILSGYGIAASLEQRAAGYYRRRFVRIWPLYLTCIAFGLLVSLRLPHGIFWPTGHFFPPATLSSIICSLLMLQTIVTYSIPIAGQIWSLSPEWWHYMLAPVLTKLSTLTLLTLLLLSFEAFMAIAPPAGGGPEGFTHGLSFITLSWLWVTGFTYRRLDRRPAGAALLAIPSVLALFFGHFTGLPLFISIFVLMVSREFKIAKECRRIFNYLGDLSFPLYLFHMPVMALMLSLGARSTPPMITAALLVSIAALHGIDYPARVFFRTRQKHPAVQLVPDRISTS